MPDFQRRMLIPLGAKNNQKNGTRNVLEEPRADKVFVCYNEESGVPLQKRHLILYRETAICHGTSNSERQQRRAWCATFRTSKQIGRKCNTFWRKSGPEL